MTIFSNEIIRINDISHSRIDTVVRDHGPVSHGGGHNSYQVDRLLSSIQKSNFNWPYYTSDELSSFSYNAISIQMYGNQELFFIAKQCEGHTIEPFRLTEEGWRILERLMFEQDELICTLIGSANSLTEFGSMIDLLTL